MAKLIALAALLILVAIGGVVLVTFNTFFHLVLNNNLENGAILTSQSDSDLFLTAKWQKN